MKIVQLHVGQGSFRREAFNCRKVFKVASFFSASVGDGRSPGTNYSAREIIHLSLICEECANYSPSIVVRNATNARLHINQLITLKALAEEPCWPFFLSSMDSSPYDEMYMVEEDEPSVADMYTPSPRNEPVSVGKQSLNQVLVHIFSRSLLQL